MSMTSNPVSAADICVACAMACPFRAASWGLLRMLCVRREAVKQTARPRDAQRL